MATRPKGLRASARGKKAENGSVVIKENRSPARCNHQTPRLEGMIEGLGKLPKFYLSHLYRATCGLGYLASSAWVSYLFLMYVIDPLPIGFTKVVMYASVSLLEIINILVVVRMSAEELWRRDSS